MKDRRNKYIYAVTIGIALDKFYRLSHGLTVTDGTEILPQIPDIVTLAIPGLLTGTLAGHAIIKTSEKIDDLYYKCMYGEKGQSLTLKK